MRAVHTMRESLCLPGRDRATTPTPHLSATPPARLLVRPIGLLGRNTLEHRGRAMRERVLSP
jgi:hypothetical protein